MVNHYLHSDVDPDGTKTMEELDQVLHELTHEVDEGRIRKLTRTVLEKCTRAAGEKRADLSGTDATWAQSGHNGLRKKA